MKVDSVVWPDEDAKPHDGERVSQSIERPVVFVLPGLGGEIDPELEEFWAPTRSVLELVTVGYLDWTDLVLAEGSLDTLIAHVKRQIESRVPSGEIRMAGYSIGGHLAYSLACQLQAAGRPAQRLVLLDSPARMEDSEPGVRARIRMRVRRVMALDTRAGLASLAAKVLIRDAARPVLRRFVPYRNARLPLRFEIYLHRKITMQLVRRMFPVWWKDKAHPGTRLATPTILFRSQEHRALQRQDLGWSELCADLTVIDVAGSHRGMLDPMVNGPLRAAFLDAMMQAKA